MSLAYPSLRVGWARETLTSALLYEVMSEFTLESYSLLPVPALDRGLSIQAIQLLRTYSLKN